MSIAYKQFKQFPEGFFEDFETRSINGVRNYITPDGNFPSMTSILSVFKEDDDYLEDWRNRIGHEEADRITNNSIKRGESLHKYCELYLKNRLDRKIMTGQGKLLFNLLKQHLDLIDVVYGLEIALYNKELKNAGRTDAIVSIGNKLTILDFKNSRKPISTDGWKSKKLFLYMMQVTGYSLALKSQYGVDAKQGCLMVGNFDTFNSNIFKFEINDFLIEQFLIINHAFHNNKEGLKKSLYFKL